MSDVFTLPAFPPPAISGPPTARHPVAWLIANEILLTRREGLDEDAVDMAFSRQLGTAWPGVLRAPAHVQAVCIAAALSLRGELELRDVLLNAVAVASRSSARTTEAAIKDLLAPHLSNEKLVGFIDRHAARHAFVNTAVIGLFGLAGGLGGWGGEAGNHPMPLHLLAWLKAMDRTLWYCLQNVGRKAFHIEGSGAIAHYLAERVVRGPLMEAHVDGAVEALVVFLEDNGIAEVG